ncbi:MAG: beta-ketoacyl synthase [Deltaproteobacteria bacterium]|nr:beta-ketoacyl synthase [Deltaproteobacteria bacterium]
MTRIGVFGWGIVAPRSPNIDAFEANLDGAESWLSPFNGFGPDNFLVGMPEFDFGVYRPWIDQRFKPNRFPQLVDKMDLPAKYAIGGFIQALSQNPGIEEELQRLGTAAHVYMGTGLGNVDTLYDASLKLYRAQRRWHRFWADPSRNAALTLYLEDPSSMATDGASIPLDPAEAPDGSRQDAEDTWWAFWAERSTDLQEFLREFAAIESLSVEGEVEAGKRRLMREKRRRQSRLIKEWGSPEPPWSQVSANVIWNIQNTPAAQISMLGGITGLSFAPVAACSTFGVALKLAMDAIRRGEAKAVVVGATDPPPHPLIVGAFYGGRVIAADGQVSKPLGGLRGTHVAGGSAVWIVGDHDYMVARGFKPCGLEPLGVGVSSDADHIITPSREGPTNAIQGALSEAGVGPEEIASWDLHATATPGDFKEVETLRAVMSERVLVTARKGTFGHGMSAGGGWELTAQYLGYDRKKLFPTPLSPGELNSEIATVHEKFVFDSDCEAPEGPVGKLSMGIGGVNACVVSRPW